MCDLAGHEIVPQRRVHEVALGAAAVLPGGRTKAGETGGDYLFGARGQAAALLQLIACGFCGGVGSLCACAECAEQQPGAPRTHPMYGTGPRKGQHVARHVPRRVVR